MRLLIVSIILAFSLIGCAHTQPDPVISVSPKLEESESKDIEIVPIVRLDRTEIKNTLRGLRSAETMYNDMEGIWFPTEDAERLLSIVEKTLPDALDLIDLQDSQIKSLRLAIKSYKGSIDWYIKYADYNKQMLDVALKNFKLFQQPQYAWYESRLAMYVYGIVSATVVLLTSAYLLDQIQP